MMTDQEARDWMRSRLLANVDDSPVGTKAKTKEHALQRELEHELVQEFFQFMKNRLLVGSYRYESMRDANKGNYDTNGSAIKRISRYIEGGNAEHLVDAANLCLITYVHPVHPNHHFEAIDDGEHTEKIK